MNKDWWMLLVQWTLWGVVMILIIRWLSKSRMKQRPTSEANTLRQPKSVLVLGVIGFFIFAGAAVLWNTIGKNNLTNIWTNLVFLSFMALGLVMVADYFFAWHRLSPAGLDYGKLHGRRGYVSWTEIRSVKYAPVMKWFELHTESGVIVRISVMLMGLPVFAQYVLTHVPAERIDVQAKALLVETAKGNPPSIWS